MDNSSTPPIIFPNKTPNPEAFDLNGNNDSAVTNTSNLTYLMLTSNEEDSTKSLGKDEVTNTDIVPTLNKPTVGLKDSVDNDPSNKEVVIDPTKPAVGFTDSADAVMGGDIDDQIEEFDNDEDNEQMTNLAQQARKNTTGNIGSSLQLLEFKQQHY